MSMSWRIGTWPGVSEHLDAMERSGPPADLVPAFARPIPSLVICELLGVPYQDRALFQRCTSTLLRLDVGEDAMFAARDELWQYMLDLVATKRQHPDDKASPWQRPSNVRQYFPKGSDPRAYRPDDLADVAAELNARPRKTVGWDTPAARLGL